MYFPLLECHITMCGNLVYLPVPVGTRLLVHTDQISCFSREDRTLNSSFFFFFFSLCNPRGMYPGDSDQQRHLWGCAGRWLLSTQEPWGQPQALFSRCQSRQIHGSCPGAGGLQPSHCAFLTVTWGKRHKGNLMFPPPLVASFSCQESFWILADPCNTLFHSFIKLRVILFEISQTANRLIPLKNKLGIILTRPSRKELNKLEVFPRFYFYSTIIKIKKKRV